VRTFAGEIDPFELGVLDTGHLVLFRNVWREGQRYVQGALLDRDVFVAAAIEVPYRASSVASASHLNVAFQGRVLNEIEGVIHSYVRAGSSRQLAGDVLYRARLSPPFGDVELAFLVDRLPRAPGAALLAWVAVTLSAVLIGGFYLMYRFGAGQMRLARQQQDFVSAVSHELKTPLTSIRMYGEMLKAGWADDAKRQTYYDYIHSESERLSRLIENVLQLARLTRNTQRFDLKSVTVAELVDLARSKVATQVERAGFALDVRNETPEGTAVVVDVDCATQIFINLVDNALKFSASAAVKKVELAARRLSDGSVLMTVRDYGPGVPKAQLKKIFELFYRAENELTRDTVGTGIGLALVRQLAAAMGARVDARNCEPGAEFRVEFPPNTH
jgi:signal transduction histidine kinase